MERVDVDDVEPLGVVEPDRRGLTEPLGAENVAVNRYALDPGEAFSGGLHTHLDQEELFYVFEGTATFETKPAPEADPETVEVGPGEAIRFAPGEYQQGRNEGDRRVVALALGAPHGSDEVRVPEDCPECDADALAVYPAEDGMGLRCPDCGHDLGTADEE